jgi:lipopolysaccharide transport system permease protein
MASNDVVVIRPSEGWVPVDLAELWRSRELIGFLALRDVRVRYKQSLLGFGWAVLQPLLTMVVFTLLFGALLGRDGLPTVDGVPYAISTYCALVPWQLFATSVSTAGNSLVTNQHVITKVYFPRLVAPLTPILAAGVDFALAFGVLIGMLLFAGITPGPEILLLPVFVLVAVLTAFGVALWLSAANAVHRDVQHAIPFLVQIWMFATPVVYTAATVLDDRAWLAPWYALNPMVFAIEGFRYSLLGAPADLGAMALPAFGVLLPLVGGGLFFFRRMERVFADRV